MHTACLLIIPFVISTGMLAQERLFIAGRMPEPPQALLAGHPIEPAQTDPSQGVFLVPITGEEDIQHARALIADPFGTTEQLFTADIGYADEYTLNRNYRVQGAPAWSWKVTRFVDYADFIAEVYDGNPELVENDLQYWVENLGRIGFWDYTIVGEFPIQPIVKVDRYWRYCPWFGYFHDAYYPWIYHPDEGWVYVFGFDPASIWMWSAARGFFWTTEELYPDVLEP